MDVNLLKQKNEWVWKIVQIIVMLCSGKCIGQFRRTVPLSVGMYVLSVCVRARVCDIHMVLM